MCFSSLSFFGFDSFLLCSLNAIGCACVTLFSFDIFCIDTQRTKLCLIFFFFFSKIEFFHWYRTAVMATVVAWDVVVVVAVAIFDCSYCCVNNKFLLFLSSVLVLVLSQDAHCLKTQYMTITNKQIVILPNVADTIVCIAFAFVAVSFRLVQIIPHFIWHSNSICSFPLSFCLSHAPVLSLSASLFHSPSVCRSPLFSLIVSDSILNKL